MMCPDCERTFVLKTELQRKRGGDPWRCPTDRFNRKYADLIGFRPRVIREVGK